MIRSSFITLILAFALTACQATNSGGHNPPPEGPPPPPQESEETVEASNGEVSAVFHVTPGSIEPDGQVVLTIENRGDVAIRYGRPVTVEQWDGSKWVETEQSRNTMWTMELLEVPPGEVGPEQRWPFSTEERPESGWYRFTKQIHADSTSESPSTLRLRTRVQVTE